MQNCYKQANFEFDAKFVSRNSTLRLCSMHAHAWARNAKTLDSFVAISMFLCLLFGLTSLWQKFTIVQPFASLKAGAIGHHRISRLPIFQSGCDNDEKLVPMDRNLEEKSFPRRLFFLGITEGLLIAPSMLSVAAATTPTITSKSSAAAPTAAAVPSLTRELSWPLGKVAFSLLPLAGTSTRRATVEETIVDGHIWTHDQLQGIVNVNVPVRQIVVRLSIKSGGGLWVLNPVAPTPQLMDMMRNLEHQFGPVRHIVLGTVALEHKATFGPFAQKFPKATVWVQPGQWSFPLSLPLAPALGVIQKGSQLRELVPQQYSSASSSKEQPEWVNDIDYEILGPLLFRSVGGFSETAFFHKTTRTLLVTDTVVSVPVEPPPILQEDPRALLYHARDSIKDVVQDTPEVRRKGWRRMVQFGLVFFPSQIDVVPFQRALKEAFQIDPRMRTLGEGAVPLSLYPWTWNSGDADLKNFEAISQSGKIFCPPILTKLILDREPDRVLEWVDAVAKRFNFVRILPGHLANNIISSPKEFKEAFEILNSNSERRGTQRPLAEDLALLQQASDLLTKLSIVDASKVCDGEPARTVGRFRSKKN